MGQSSGQSDESGAWGAWNGLKARAVSLLTLAHTRLELLGNELEVARHDATRQLMLALALLFCIALAVVLSVFALTVLFWEQRLIVMGISCAVMWLAVFYFANILRRDAQKAEPIFSASLAELQEDLRQLKAAAATRPSRHERAPD